MIIVITSGEIKTYLDFLVDDEPFSVRNRFEKGDIIAKSYHFGYEIDDTNLPDRLGYRKGENPYWKIYNLFKPYDKFSYEIIGQTFGMEGKDIGNGDILLPFSRMVEIGRGQCSEASMLGQLYSQKFMDTYYVPGRVKLSEEEYVELHAYLIIINKEAPLLVDIALPLEREIRGEIKHIPCFLEIGGIEEDFVVLKNGEGRKYWIGL